MEWVRKNVEKHFHSDLTVTFFRHGKTKRYEEIGKGLYEEALTEEGEQQVIQSAVLLAQHIKSRDEVVLIWASPRTRTQQTAHILAETLEKYGAFVLYREAGSSGKKYRECALLRSPNLTEDFWKQKGEGESFVPLWHELSDANLLPEGTEHYNDHESRLKKVLEYSKKIAKIGKEHEDRPFTRLILVCHFETVTPILQQAFGGDIGVARGKGLDKAGCLNIDVQEVDEGNIQAILRIQFDKSAYEKDGSQQTVYLLFDKQNELTKIV